jgi:hypothetical protein
VVVLVDYNEQIVSEVHSWWQVECVWLTAICPSVEPEPDTIQSCSVSFMRSVSRKQGACYFGKSSGVKLGAVSGVVRRAGKFRRSN